MRTIRISPLWIVIAVLGLCLAGVSWWSRGTYMSHKMSQDSLMSNIVYKDSQIVKLNLHYAALEQQLSLARHNDSLKAKSVVIRDLIIKKLKDKISAVDSIKLISRDSALGYIIGEYKVPLDTLYLMGADIPWLIAEDITKSDLLDSIVPVMDKQIGELKAINTIKAKAITHLTGMVANRDSVVKVQMSQLALKNQIIEQQGKKIRLYKLGLIGSGIIVLIAVL